MGQVLVRDLSIRTVLRLKRRAKRHGKSLQAEAKAILERAAEMDIDEARVLAGRIRRKLAGRGFGDSAALIAGDRKR